MRQAQVRRWSVGLALVWALGALAQHAPDMPEQDVEDTFARGELKARLEAIDAALEAWDIPGARQALAQAEAVAPADSEPILYFRGRVAFEEGRYDEAVDLLTKAGMGDKPGSYLRLAQDTAKITAGYEAKESDHFIFAYPPGKDAILAPYALETLEAIRAALLADLGYAPPGKVRVEVVDDAGGLAKMSTLTREQIRKTGTIAICKFNKLIITSPKAVLRGYDWQDTLAHEYIHLVVSQKSRNQVPIWLHEGIAKYLESRWRGPAGQAMTPAMQALLGRRVKQDKLIPFEKMHPSIALLPTAEDAATAFAEVFYAIDLLHRQYGVASVAQVIDQLEAGKTDKAAVEAATGKSFPAFEKAWLAHVRGQKFPAELLPLTDVVLNEDAPGAAKKKDKKGKEISFGDFNEVTESEARKFAHLGELMRERNRSKAAAEEYGKAHRIVGDKYQVISDKYALALLGIGDTGRAEQVLQGSLRVHPGTASTLVHLGRIYLARKDWQKAKRAMLDALSSDPFDPEIHVSLVGIHAALNEPALRGRARDAAALLTRLAPEDVDRLAQSFVGRQGEALAEKAVEAASDTAPAAPAASDGGTPPPPVR